MAEHGLIEPVIGVTFDGTGYGTDGAIWGGEFLVGDYRAFRRAAHLRYVGMPGGDRPSASRGGWPWRTCSTPAIRRTNSLSACQPLEAIRTIERMLETGFSTPLTSSAGRLFDAVAALAGVRDRVSYEGQAAMELEWLATGVGGKRGYPFELDRSAGR